MAFLEGAVLSVATGQTASTGDPSSLSDWNPPILPSPQTADLDAGFDHPNQASGPWVFWRWPWNEAHLINNDNIDTELKAMSAQGLGGIRCDTVGSPEPGKSFAAYMSQPWLDLIAHVRSEKAPELGIRYFTDDCDGWATSGGPWITPETSMKDLTFSKTQMSGPQSYAQALPEPPSKLSFYRDVAVLAYADAGDASPDKVVNLSRLDE